MSTHCAVSADGRHLGIRRDRTVTIHAIAPDAASFGAIIAEASVPHDDGVLAFAGHHLVDLAVVGDRTVVTTMTFPKVKATSIELPVPVRLLTGTERHLVLGGPQTGYVLTMMGDAAGWAPLRLAARLDWAVAIGDDEVLASSPRGVEVWQPSSRLPRHKLKLDLPAPRAIGVGIGRSSLWILTAEHDVLITRISDGKPSRIALRGYPTDPVGHPQSSWLVADLDGATYAINLVTAVCEPVAAPPARARVLVPRGSGALLGQVGADGQLDLWELAASAPSPKRSGLTVEMAPSTTPAMAPPVPAAPRAAPKPVAVTLSLPGLHPEVALSLIAGPGRAEPPSVSRWVAPDRERRFAGLAARLRQSWTDLILEAWLAGGRAEPERVARQLGAEARQLAVAQLGGDGEVDDQGALVLRAPLLAEEPQAKWPALRAALGTASVELSLGDDLAAVGRALGALACGTPVGDEPAARRALDLLRAGGLVLDAHASPAFAGQLDEDTVATLGLHGLLANLAGGHVLIDPLLGARGIGSVLGLPAPSVVDLPLLEAIVLSGDDPAVLDPATLLGLDKEVPVLIPAGARSDWVAALLEDLGFATVRRLAPDEGQPIGDGGEVIALALPDPAARPRLRAAWALVGRAGATLTCGALPLGDGDVAALAGALAPIRARAGAISPIFVAAPRRLHAPIESGWLWLLEPLATWLTATPPSPARLTPLVEAAGATSVVVVGEDAAVPEELGVLGRQTDAYDRYRLGGAQDGWLEPRRSDT